MIKLAKYIPLKEIKIVPNLRQEPKIGDIWTFYQDGDEVNLQIVDIGKDELETPFVEFNRFNGNDFITTSIKGLEGFIGKLKHLGAKLNRSKVLKEIKINPQPNQKQPKIGRIYRINDYFKDESGTYEVTEYDDYFKEYKLTNIKDKHNYTWYTKEEIEKHIKNKEFEIISEIKIIPNNGIPRNNEELEKFIIKIYQNLYKR